MLRRILIARHAKTEGSHAEGDFARQLTERGVQDARALAAYLQAEGLQPQLILCSTATRTRQTLAHLNLTVPTELHAGMYLASSEDLLAQLQQCDDAVQDVLLIGHNPGVHGLAAGLMQDAAHEADMQALASHYPTSTLTLLEVPLAHWADLHMHSARLMRYHTARAADAV